VLPSGLGARINLAEVPVLPVFRWLAEEGRIAENELLRTFNCGIGMIVVVSPRDLDAVAQAFARSGETPVKLGTIIRASADARVVYDSKLRLG
jgi:phosphoribosylformylglycinamidine cyclo-ligase